MACGQFFLLLLMPLGLAPRRHIEHEADRFGLELTHYNHSAATGFVRFQADELIVPWPGWFYMMVRASHPSEGERIQFYNTYRPWENGGSIKYEGHFSPEPTKPKAAVSD